LTSLNFGLKLFRFGIGVRQLDALALAIGAAARVPVVPPLDSKECEYGLAPPSRWLLE
jgi:hypothetical protein